LQELLHQQYISAFSHNLLQSAAVTAVDAVDCSAWCRQGCYSRRSISSSSMLQMGMEGLQTHSSKVFVPVG
jgi:hypothetical protein